MAKKTVLVADADPRSLRLVEMALRRAGFAVVEAATGEEAMRALAGARGPAGAGLDARRPGDRRGARTARRRSRFLAADDLGERRVSGRLRRSPSRAANPLRDPGGADGVDAPDRRAGPHGAGDSIRGAACRGRRPSRSSPLRPAR